MPGSIVVRLAIRITASEGACASCLRDDYRVGFRLDDIHASGCVRAHGVTVCPACVASYGYHHAVIRALAAEEAETVAQDRMADTGLIDAIRTLYAHLRSLVVSGRIKTPPTIGLEHIGDG